MSTRRSLCEECGWHGNGDDLLSAPHPFDDEATIRGCPECLGVNLTFACDDEGCPKRPEVGTPTPDGYRWTCGEHEPKERP